MEGDPFDIAPVAASFYFRAVSFPLYMFLKPDDAIRFAIAFLVIYFLYAIFEIVVLKKENETKKDNVGIQKSAIMCAHRRLPR